MSTVRERVRRSFGGGWETDRESAGALAERLAEAYPDEERRRWIWRAMREWARQREGR